MTKEVSILVFVELALERDAIVLPKLGRIVSILVFVELALEPHDQGDIQLDERSFNPCFCGTGARTAERRVYGEFEREGFNPCFCGTGARTLPQGSEA